MRMTAIVALSWVSAVCTTVAASAADVGSHPPVISPEAAIPAESGGNWYIRGDVGYSGNLAPSMSWQSTSYSNLQSGGSATLGLGIGYRFNENLRSDLTLDFLTNHRISGVLSATQSDRVTQSSGALLANGYFDFSRFMGFTPYIGAGIGIAQVSTNPLSRDVSGTPTYTFASATQYALSAAAMTGVSFDIAPNLQADVGYKFNWIDKVHTGTSPSLSGPVTIGDTSSHQFRVGLKYFIN